MNTRHKLATLVLVSGLLAGGLTAHVRLFNPGNQKKLFWEKPAKIAIVIDPAGSDDILDESDTTAVRLGMRAWNADVGSQARLNEKTASVADACAEWTDFGSHLVFFDETNCSGFFPGGSQAVAVTPVLFQTNGKIVDADVIFNGLGFAFTTSGDPGAFDVQDVGTHELGHLLGLDHSGWAGATMYPYVDPNLILQRSLSEDDVHGLRHAYPKGSHGRIDGQVRRLANNSGVAGAHVYAVDDSGRTAGAALADPGGNYSLRGLDAGTYTVHANPLTGTVTAGNLQAGRVIETDFEATAGSAVVVGAGQTVSAPDLLVDATVGLTLGSAFDALPLEARAGSSIPHSLSGSSLALGSSLTPSDPSITLGAVTWLGAAVNFTVTTPPGATPGHVDLVAQNGSERAVLVSALEVVPPAPTVTGATPTKGNDIGGTAVTISGTGFRPGACVILGAAIYHDGEVGGCTVVDDTTITLTTAGSSTGTYDVVVMDATGVEGRDPAGFTVSTIPVLTTRFPASGSAAGGTELVLTGDNFQPGLVVRIDGVVQSAVTLEDVTTVRVTTDPGAAGGPYVLEVENPGGEAATSAFSYVAQADPLLLDLTPGSGAPAGGKLVTVSGAGFTANTAVEFGVDPLTGLGGLPAQGVVFVDTNTLQVTTPALSAGRVAVMALDAITGQASVLPDAFLFKAPGSGGGGGCYTVPFDSGARPDPYLGAVSLLLLAALVIGYARFVRRRALPRS